MKETDKGLVFSGARMLATLAPASDEQFVAPSPSRSYSGSGNPRAFAFARRSSATPTYPELVESILNHEPATLP